MRRLRISIDPYVAAAIGKDELVADFVGLPRWRARRVGRWAGAAPVPQLQPGARLHRGLVFQSDVVRLRPDVDSGEWVQRRHARRLRFRRPQPGDQQDVPVLREERQPRAANEQRYRLVQLQG